LTRAVDRQGVPLARAALAVQTDEAASALLAKRGRIAGAKWENLRGKTQRQQAGFRTAEEISLPVDEELAWAIEAFRKQKLHEIDAQLRELGVNPTKEEVAAEPVGKLTSGPVGELCTELVGSLRTVRQA
jgi:hypothetical protein